MDSSIAERERAAEPEDITRLIVQRMNAEDAEGCHGRRSRAEWSCSPRRFAAGQAAAVAHVAAHELGAAAYAIKTRWRIPPGPMSAGPRHARRGWRIECQPQPKGRISALSAERRTGHGAADAVRR